MSDLNFDPNVSSAPAPSDIPAPSPATATPVAQPTGAPATTVAPSQPPATGGAPPPGYVPSYRVRETREQYEGKIAEMQTAANAQIEALNRKIQALAGVTPQSQSEEDVIRQQLFKVVPDLKELLELREQLKEVAAQRSEYAEQNQHYWNSYNATQAERLFAKASESYEQPLNDNQKRYLVASFVGWAQGDPEIAARYKTDPSVIDEFWREYSSNVIEPARRAATSSAVGRVASNLPQDTPSGGLRTSQPPQAPANLDDRVGLAWQAFNAAKSGV